MLKILRPSTLQWYVLREFALAFALAMLACTLFMLLGTFFMMASDFEEYGITTGQVALLTPFILAKPVSYALPLAGMIAATMVFGRLCSENEILAAQAGGAPIRALVLPVAFCGAVLSAISLWCNDEGLRWGFQIIREEILKVDKPEFFKNLDKPGSNLTMKLDGGGLVRINVLPFKTGPAGGALRKPIHITYFQKDDVGQTILAEDHVYNNLDEAPKSTGERVLKLTLMDARILGDRPAFSDKITWDFTLPNLKEQITIGNTRGQKGWADNLRDAQRVKDSLKARRDYLLHRAADFGAMAAAGSPADPAAAVLAVNSLNDARVAAEAIYGNGGAAERIRADEAEFHKKLALSFLPLSMVILGIGLGLLVRKSQRLIGFLLGIIVYALIYYPMMIVSKQIAISGHIGFKALYLPNLLLLALGYVLWRFYERGWPSRLTNATVSALDWLRTAGKALWRPFETWRDRPIHFFSRKTDNYVAGTFVFPLLIVILAVGGMFIALDLVEHGSEVFDGIVRAGEPLGGLPARSDAQAVVDVGVYYSIRTVEVICDILPLLILLAGVLCVMVLVRNQEHLILKSAGVPLYRAFMPIWVITLVFSLSVSIFRETLLPSLILQRDYLKPLIYHRGASPTALALYTADRDGKAMIFEMSQWNSNARSGKDMRVFLLGEAKSKRIPMIKADLASWEGGVWKLQMDPMRQILARNAAAGRANTAPVKEIPRIPHGSLLAEIQNASQPAQASQPEKLETVAFSKTPMPTWEGPVSPAFIESERLGTGVMRLDQLMSASRFKPVLNVDWWRRISEFVMGVFLLWAALPLLLTEESRGPAAGLALCILFGAGYWVLCMAAAGAARSDYLPSWAPLLPHVFFAVFGYRRYYLKMVT